MTGETGDRLPAVVAPSGRLDAAAAPTLRHSLSGALGGEHPQVIVNMTGVSYVSSAGLRALLAAHRQAQRSGGHLVICCLQMQIGRVLHMVGLDQVLVVADTEGDARLMLGSFQPPTTTHKGQP
jgi:anti-sigma B factor antagonist